jgi:hypothetical protein
MSTRDYARGGGGTLVVLGGGGSLRNLYEDEDDDYMPTTPTEASHSSSLTSFDHSPTNSEERSEPRRSLRKSIAFALTSPVRVAKDRITLTSPRRLSRTMRNSFSKTGESARNLLLSKKEPLTWRDELDLPSNTTKEEAMAFLLCRELELMDL